MPLTIAHFFDRLRDSHVLAPDEFEAISKKVSKDKRGQDARRLVARLIEAKRLTPYQASAILEGHHKSLVLGDYLILSKIAAGGMGEVFKARHRRMKRLVAIKVLPPAVMAKPEVVKRFQREVEAAARLLHPNIVAALDAGAQKGTHYLVMEYVDGDDLAGIVNKHGPLRASTAVHYVVQAARGLAHAHAKGVIHRDIKPGNLLLDAQGTVKILDMGLARFDHPADELSEGLTESGTLMGTIDYMSPEQALSTKGVDGRADIYSLGCTLYFLLTGKRMYDVGKVMKRLVAHRDKPIPQLYAAQGDLPQGLAAVFERMVAKLPQDRYQSMDEVCAALLAVAPVQAGMLTAAGDQSSGNQAHLYSGGPPTAGYIEPLPPPLPASITVVGQEEVSTRGESRPGLTPFTTPSDSGLDLSDSSVSGPRFSVWRLLTTPLVTLDKSLAQIAGPGNRTAHVLLRGVVAVLLALVLLVTGFYIWDAWCSGR